VRIGDFGLASDGGKAAAHIDPDGASGSSHHRDRGKAVLDSDMESLPEDASALTGGVGTSLYCAPEVLNARNERGAGAQYDCKADMYSMGIVLFEMSQPRFATGSERITVIRNLREKGEFPRSYKATVAMKEAVLWLTQKDPAKRPTAHEMLGSNLLPLPPLDIKEVTDALKQDAEATTSLVRSLFSEEFHANSSSSGDQYAYDRELLVSTLRMIKPHSLDTVGTHLHPRKAAHTARHLVPVQVRESMVNALHNIFHCRGGVQVLAPLLQLGTEEGGAHQFFDRAGRLVSLQTNLFVNYARLVARSGISNIRRYQISPVYKLGGGDQHPQQQLEAAYDVTITNDSTPAAALLVREAEADVLCTSTEILNKIRLVGKAQLCVSDDRITKAIIDVCLWGAPLGDLPMDTARDVCSEYFRGGDASQLPAVVMTRLANFQKVLSQQDKDDGGGGVVAVLNELEAHFFKSAAVLALQQQLSGNKASAPAVKKKGAEVAPSAAQAQVAKVDLSAALLAIGRPSAKAKSSTPQKPTNVVSGGSAPTSANVSVADEGANDVFDKKDLKRYRSILKSFDSAVSALREALTHVLAQQKVFAAASPDTPPLSVAFHAAEARDGVFDRDALRFVCEVDVPKGGGSSSGGVRQATVRRRVLEGGHFSRLVASFAEKDSKQGRVVSVGLRLNVEGLASVLMTQLGSACSAAYDCVVTSHSHGPVTTHDDALQISAVLAQLRNANLRAITAHSLMGGQAVDFRGLLAICEQLSVGALLTVGAQDALNANVFFPGRHESAAIVHVEKVPAMLLRALDRFAFSRGGVVDDVGGGRGGKAAVAAQLEPHKNKGDKGKGAATAEAVMLVLSHSGSLRDKDKPSKIKKAMYAEKVADFLYSLLGVRYRLVDKRSPSTSGPVVLVSDAKKATLQRLCAFVHAQGSQALQRLTVDAVSLPDSAEADRKHVKLILGEVRLLRDTSLVLYSTPDESWDILRV